MPRRWRALSPIEFWHSETRQAIPAYDCRECRRGAAWWMAPHFLLGRCRRSLSLLHVPLCYPGCLPLSWAAGLRTPANKLKTPLKLKLLTMIVEIFCRSGMVKVCDLLSYDLPSTCDLDFQVSGFTRP